MKKRFLAIILALVMCLALLPTAALAAEEFEMDGTTLVKYHGPGGAVTIPNGVTSIGENAFDGCEGLTSVTIPNSVKKINTGAFKNCTGLTSATIPGSITTISSNMFMGCTNLTAIQVDSNSPYPFFSSMDGVLFSSYMKTLQEYPAGKQGAYSIPNSVTIISLGAFDGCRGLTNVTIPNSVTRIGHRAFGSCTGLTSVTIPNSVTNIDTSAFQNCTGLIGVTIPNSVTSIGGGAFYGCTGLKDVYYAGTEAQWKAIKVDDYCNDPLLNATIHYNSTVSVKPEQITQPQQPAESKPSTNNEKEIAQKFVDLALAQRGKTASDLGLSGEWCGFFISWCAKQYSLQYKEDNIDLTEIISPQGNYGSTHYGYAIKNGGTGVRFYDHYPEGDVMKLGMLLSDRNDYSPQTGDIVLFTYDHYDSDLKTRVGPYGKNIAHVGIVHSVSNGQIKVVHGNWYVNNKSIVVGPGDEGKCTVSWPITSPEIYGYARPNWAAVAQLKQPTTSTTANPTNDTLKVNGVSMDPVAYKIDGANYFKLRDIAVLLSGTAKQFNVEYDDALKAITITSGEAYTKLPTDLYNALTSDQLASPTNNAVYINGEKASLTVYKIGGNNYFKLRELGQALDFYVGWNVQDGVFIDTGRGYDPNS